MKMLAQSFHFIFVDFLENWISFRRKTNKTGFDLNSILKKTTIYLVFINYDQKTRIKHIIKLTAVVTIILFSFFSSNWFYG